MIICAQDLKCCWSVPQTAKSFSILREHKPIHTWSVSAFTIHSSPPQAREPIDQIKTNIAPGHLNLNSPSTFELVRGCLSSARTSWRKLKALTCTIAAEIREHAFWFGRHELQGKLFSQILSISQPASAACEERKHSQVLGKGAPCPGRYGLRTLLCLCL